MRILKTDPDFDNWDVCLDGVRVDEPILEASTDGYIIKRVSSHDYLGYSTLRVNGRVELISRHTGRVVRKEKS